MEQFQLAQTLQNKRKELQVTQEILANYLGVSRAAVSKWEKGLSYPDITLLPKLATFFNLSIDTLLGYEPQMTTDQINKKYALLANRLAKEPFKEIDLEIDELVKEYYSCYPLLLKVVQLYINYYQKADNVPQLLSKALNICERVKNGSSDISLKNEAITLQALINILQGDAQGVLDLLGDEPKLEHGTDQLIATALSMLGNSHKAKETLQVSMYQHLLSAISTATESLLLNIDNEAHFEQTVYRIEKMILLFNMKELQINVALVFYIKAATGYMLLKNVDKALQLLTQYEKACRSVQFPLKLSGDDYFYLLEGWISRQLQLNIQAPRDEYSIKKDLLGTIQNNPVFEPISEDETFKAICIQLKNTLKVEEV